MHQSRTLYIGLDVHKESIAVAYVAQAHHAAIVSLGNLGTGLARDAGEGGRHQRGSSRVLIAPRRRQDDERGVDRLEWGAEGGERGIAVGAAPACAGGGRARSCCTLATSIPTKT